MAEALDELLDVHGDQGLILDDHDLGGDLAGNLDRGLVEQGGEFVVTDREDFGGLGMAEPFHSHQQESLAGQGGEIGQVRGCALFPRKAR
ncbi:hypothetical protein D3C87_1793230 [compost metagenome]